MKNIFIVDALRTAIGGQNKSLKDVSAVTLGAEVIKELVKRNKIPANSVDEVIMGNTVSAGLGQNPARQALVKAGLNSMTPGFTINKVCGSGLKAVILAVQSIACEDTDLVLAGGMESASLSPYLIARKDKKPAGPFEGEAKDSLVYDGLWCGLSDVHMGVLAEFTANNFGISRSEQDDYAMQSHHKACYAIENKLFESEIVPVTVDENRVFSVDEKPRKGVTMERLAKLPTVFSSNGTVTAGNSPPPADGAAALIIASQAGLDKSGAAPIARILGYAVAAVEPKMVFTASSVAIKKCLAKCGLKIEDVDLFELNEAFAVQSVLTLRETKIDKDRTNIFGGTIALGHPLGASGARGLVTLINALKKQNKKIGITAICLGGGCAVALAVSMQ